MSMITWAKKSMLRIHRKCQVRRARKIHDRISSMLTEEQNGGVTWEEYERDREKILRRVENAFLGEVAAWEARMRYLRVEEDDLVRQIADYEISSEESERREIACWRRKYEKAVSDEKPNEVIENILSMRPRERTEEDHEFFDQYRHDEREKCVARLKVVRKKIVNELRGR